MQWRCSSLRPARHSVSQDSEWKTAGTNFVSIKYRKVHGIVYVSVDNIYCGTGSDLTWHGIMLPAGYRPSADAEPYFPVGHMDSSGNSGMCKIKADGGIGAIGPKADIYYGGYVSYPADA